MQNFFLTKGKQTHYHTYFRVLSLILLIVETKTIQYSHLKSKYHNTLQGKAEPKNHCQGRRDKCSVVFPLV